VIGCHWARLIALLLCATASSVRAGDLILPEWDYEPNPQGSAVKRAATRTAQLSYGFLNDTVSDTWSITTSPIRWRAKGWLTLAGVAGVTTGMVYLVDERVRDAAQGSESFKDFGDAIRYVGSGPGLLALTGGFAATGFIFQRPKELETARLLLEASVIGYGFGAAAKYTLGRSRPGAEEGPRDFHPFSGEFSMPSGETTNAFVMAGVVTSQYPSWPVQIVAYSLAAGVGAGRIAADGHWSSDVFLGAALGIAISKAVVHLNRRRAAARRQGRSKELPFARHFVQVSTRGFRWTYRF
jgi:membrane-associated phospholipid phosphatase